jgi:hypothetical protein
LFPNLCLVNRSIGGEATAYLLSLSRIFISGGRKLKRFMSMIERLGTQNLHYAIHKLAFHDIDSFWRGELNHDYCLSDEFNPHMALVSRCTQLRELDITFRPVRMRARRFSDIQPIKYPIRSFGEFADGLNLKSIVETPQLYRIRLFGDEPRDAEDILDAWDSPEVGKEPLIVLFGLRDWLLDEFAKKGRVVEVEVSQRISASRNM